MPTRCALMSPALRQRLHRCLTRALDQAEEDDDRCSPIPYGSSILHAMPTAMSDVIRGTRASLHLPSASEKLHSTRNVPPGPS
ncbi:unnamed protein product [Musa hybrid cultivar]